MSEEKINITDEIVKNTNLVVFEDKIGRISFAEFVSRDEDILTVKNIAVVNINQPKGPNEKPALGLIPNFFTNLLERPDADITWKINVNNIALSDAPLNDNAKKLYLLTFNKIQMGQQIPQPSEEKEVEGKVVKMFDD